MSLQGAIDRVQNAASTAEDEDSHANLLSEIHKLQLAAERPEETIMRLRRDFMPIFATKFALDYGILQFLAERGDTMSAKELSDKTGAEESLILRVLRLVTYHGICQEVGHGVYAANDCTKFLVRTPISGGFHYIYHFGLQTVSKIPALIRNKSLYEFPNGADQRSPIQHAFGDTMFGVLERDAEQKKVFDDYMQARAFSKDPKWFEIFPMRAVLDECARMGEDDTLVVDVGGGKGHDLVAFRQKFPDHPGRLVLQDLAQTFQALPVTPGGIELNVHDFFMEQPIKGARIYLLHAVLHDWPDDKALVILQRLAEAMGPASSRLLVCELVVPEVDAHWTTASLDLCMWMFFSGIERTRMQWERLFEAAGLEIVAVWSTAAFKESVIELRRRP